MKRKEICGITVLLLVMCLSIPAWSYSLELQYFPDSNLADAYARRTPTSGGGEVKPGQQSGSGIVLQSATTGGSPAIAEGGATVTPAVVSTDSVAAQSVIHTYAAAGHTVGSYYEGYGLGYGDTYFGFVIAPGPGEASQVFATIGFTVSGSINLGKAGDFNNLILEYNSSLMNFFGADNDLQIAGKTLTWQGTTGSTNYSNGGEVTLRLDTDTFYWFFGQMQVDAEAYGLNFSGENRIDFDDYLPIDNIRAVPVPAGIVLLGSGLFLLGVSSWRFRG